MELRHRRCFVAAAEELHFAWAAEKLHMHIEQSPLSRARFAEIGDEDIACPSERRHGRRLHS
jgi:hypothetical protein